MDLEAILNNKPKNNATECKTDAKPEQKCSPKCPQAEKINENTAA